MSQSSSRSRHVSRGRRGDRRGNRRSPYPESGESSRTRSTNLENDEGSRTRSTSPYDEHFRQRMIESGVFPLNHRIDGRRLPEAANINEIRSRLDRYRLSTSPSAIPDSDYHQYCDDEDDATHLNPTPERSRSRVEDRILNASLPRLQGASESNYRSERERLFDLELFDEELTRPKPDLYYGTAPFMIDDQVKNDLNRYIKPSSGNYLPVAPNYFLEAKGPGGSEGVAINQAMNDGAVGARAMYHLQNYGNPNPVYDGNAYSLASTYIGGNLSFYATHPAASSQPPLPSSTSTPTASSSYVPPTNVGRPTQPHLAPAPAARAGSSVSSALYQPPYPTARPPPDGNTYLMSRVNAYNMKFSPDSYRAGIRAFRNARELADEQRDAFARQANQAARGGNPRR